MRKINRSTLIFLIISLLYISDIILSGAVSDSYIYIFQTKLYFSLITISLAYFLICFFSEFYCYKKVNYIIWIGFTYKIALLLYDIVNSSLALKGDKALSFIFDQAFRSEISSIIAYLAGSLICTFIFLRIKAITHEKHFWLRAICAILAGSGIDTMIYLNAAYMGVLPYAVIGKMFYMQFVSKFLIGIIFIPAVRLYKYLLD